MDYLSYHLKSAAIRDIDPANDCLTYIADRFELNIEQRYWIAFLYGTCYCAPTVFYMYNEFPDFQNVDVKRLQRWWDSNKQRCVFQTDRLRIKTGDKFVETFQSYRELIAVMGNGSQQHAFSRLLGLTPEISYYNAYKVANSIKNFGRFTLFIYLEMVNLLTDFKCSPQRIDWQHAENCAIGLCYAFDRNPNLYSTAYAVNRQWLDKKLVEAQLSIQIAGCRLHNIFNIETTLCAYAKFKKGQRYVGYYIDRQRKEIDKMTSNVPEGVCWTVLEQFRNETYTHKFCLT